MRTKLLFLGAPFEVYRGGSERQYSELEKVLRANFDIYYLFRHKGELNTPSYVTYDYSFRRQYHRYNYSDAWKVYRLIRRIAPDIIYKRGGNYIFGVGAMYAKRNNAKLIWHVAHETDVLPYGFKRKKNSWREFIDKNIIKRAIKSADVIVGQAEYQDSLLKKWFGRGCDFVLPNLHPMPGIEAIKLTDRIQVVWIANLKPWKRPEVFISLAKELGAPECKFILAGRPGARLWQKSLEKQMAAVKHLDYLGEIDDSQVNTLLGESHIFVNTSDNEGFPNTFIEAWLRKVVPVSLSVDPDGLLTSKKMGKVSGSIENLASDVQTLIRNDALREQMAQAGYDYAVRTHLVENNIDRVLEIFARQK